MGSITVRVRSVVWFVTGALLATTVTLMFANAWRVDAAPGDTDATLVAITPCRLADTRPAPDRVGTAGALGVAATQTFVVHGSNGECTIPTEAVAVSLNVTAVGATEPSFLTFWPDGVRPLVSSLNPTPGEPPTPNAVTVDLSGAGGFNVYNLAGSVNVMIDINGYYTKASLKGLAERLATVEAAPTRVLALNVIGATERANDSSLQLGYLASLYLTEPTRQPVAVLLGSMATTDANLDFVLTYAARMLKLDQEKTLEQLSAQLDALKQHEDELQDRLAHNGEGSIEVVQDIAVTAAAISDNTARLLLVLHCLIQTGC